MCNRGSTPSDSSQHPIIIIVKNQNNVILNRKIITTVQPGQMTPYWRKTNVTLDIQKDSRIYSLLRLMNYYSLDKTACIEKFLMDWLSLIHGICEKLSIKF